MIRKLSFGIAGLAMLGMSGNASAVSTVAIFGDAPFGVSFSTINNLYNGLPDTTSSIIGALTPGNLTGVGLLWAIQPNSPYSGSEVGAMAGFLGAGGRIAFMGEHGGIALSQNNNINTALGSLGSTMSIIPGVIVDGGSRTASVGDGQILADPLTVGVDQYEYAAFDPLDLGANGIPLMLGEDDITDVMMGFENVGPGSIFMITDQNVLNFSPADSFDNEVMFANLLTADTGAPPPPGDDVPPVFTGIPEPATLTLFGAGILGLGWVRRRRKAG